MPSQPTRESMSVAAADDRAAVKQSEAGDDQAILNSLHGGIAFIRRHLQGLGVGIGMFSADWSRVTFVSGTFERMFACTQDELEVEPTRWMRCIDPQDALVVQNLVNNVVAGESREVTFRIHGQGQTQWIRARCLLAMAESKSPHLVVAFEDVTDRHLAEIALQESEAKYRRIVETANEGIMVFDAQWRITFVNARLVELFETPAGQMLGKHVMDFVSPDEVASTRERIELRQQGVKETYQIKIRLDGERERWIRIATNPMLDGEGRFLGSLAMMSDITDQTHAEQAVRDSQARFRALAVHSPVGIFQCDHQGNCLFVNNRYLTIAGVPECEAEGLGWLKTVHPLDRDEIFADGEHAWKRREEFTHEFRFLQEDGTVRWVWANAIQTCDENGRVTGCLGNVLDITERKQIEDALRESEQRFRLLSNSSPVGIFVSDEAGQLVYTNPRMQAIYGYDANELSGLGFTRVYYPEDYAAALANWLRVSRTNEPHNLERRFIHANGEKRWVRVRSSLMFSGDGAVLGRVGTLEDITDHRQALLELQSSEERYRMLADNSTDMISHLAADGTVIFSSPASRTLLGYEPEEMVGLKSFDLLHPDDRAPFSAAASVNANTSIVATLMFRYRRKNGDYVWLETMYRSIAGLTPDSQETIVVVSRDVTERTQSAEQLRESEARFRMLAEHSTDMISTHAPDGRMRFVSPACRTLVGYEPEELIGKRPVEFLHPDERAAYAATIAANAEVPEVASLMFRFRRKDGIYVWLEAMYRKIPGDALDSLETTVVVSRDVTERRQAAEQLRESEARLRGILDTVTDGIVTVNESLIIEQFNPGAQRLFGYSAQDMLGRHIRLLIPAAGDADFQNSTRRRGGSARIRAREVTGRCKDGAKRELEMRVGAMEFAGGTIFTAILHDIGDRKRIDKTLRENEKLAATGRIAARIAHEINNPLAGIRNSFLLIKDGISAEHPYFSYVGRIEKEIDRIARIVRQMFDLHRPDYVTPCDVELHETIGDVVALLDGIARARGVTLAVDVAGAEGRVNLPEDSLRQVLYNIIVNAIEASSAGSVVGIKATLSASDVEILVADRGEGIALAVQSQIYEPFFTTKSQSGTGGLGLGLPISKGLVEAMQGSLDFERTSRSGTVFRVTIPVRQSGPEVEHD